MDIHNLVLSFFMDLPFIKFTPTVCYVCSMQLVLSPRTTVESELMCAVLGKPWVEKEFILDKYVKPWQDLLIPSFENCIAAKTYKGYVELIYKKLRERQLF